MWTVILSVVAGVIIWLTSWFQDINPDQVAMRQWFGYIEEKILNPGLHVVPTFFGRIKLRTAPTKMYHIQFRKEHGTAFVVRAKEDISRKRQPVKMWVDAASFFRVAYESPKELKWLFQSDVPLDDEDALLKWIFQASSTDVVAMFGKRFYEDVMGGKANDELTEELRKIITDPKSLFVTCGLFGKDVNDHSIGSGEFYFKIEFVHLPDDISQNINNVENAHLGAEASEHAADADYRRIYGPAIRAIGSGEKLSVEDVANLRMTDLAPGSVQVQRSQSDNKFDVQSGGQPINPNFAGGIAAAEIIGDAIARAFGKKGPVRQSDKPGGKGNQGRRGGGQQSPQKGKKMTLDEAREYFKEQFGYDPDW